MTVYGPYPAKVAAIHDGDTITLDLDLGFAITLRLACRVYGINAPELATDAGKAALAYLLTQLSVGASVQVVSHGWDKYGGRFLGSVTLPDGRDLSALMIAAQQAVPYFGHGPKGFAVQPEGQTP